VIRAGISSRRLGQAGNADPGSYPSDRRGLRETFRRPLRCAGRGWWPRSAAPPLDVFRASHRWISLFWMTRRSFACHGERSLADFVEKYRSPLAYSNRPAPGLVAPGEAPRRWPNNWLSSSVSTIAEQLQTANRLMGYRLSWWMAWGHELFSFDPWGLQEERSLMLRNLARHLKDVDMAGLWLTIP